VTELLERKETTLAAFRELLCPARTEKTDKALRQARLPNWANPNEPIPRKALGVATGHGRNAAGFPGIGPQASRPTSRFTASGHGSGERDPVPAALEEFKSQGLLAESTYLPLTVLGG
jgi:hypothetical protein